ncbi:deoxyguanosinetriphosphate triphosphohydrolase [Rarobacter incanus]|uniref:Deoxyguanosinetriphosphate triphosphohydrolase-like protein n=1 Tax=Rarobacter incanus TaxID=153494 RepID=A0A542SNU4_9MICO|nr:deoxyguanosinetriphosphate triphosphohydrolase [Rarobacter incanus]TQK75927.1 dGTPase [Rarobacter incanus]
MFQVASDPGGAAFVTAVRAQYGRDDTARWVPEPAKNPARTAFERDRGRLVHSSALRRLSAKTQVLGPASDDFVRNRLTHTLEVAQVGRELGKALGCDPDVVDTACLAHDLGHPPFGHNGEQALSELASGIGGFEGNAQTLRLLTRLEPKVIDAEGRSAGLNLTRASLDASVKYPWSYFDRPMGLNGRPTQKFGVYQDDLPVFTWLREGAAAGKKCLEAQIMDLADDVAYSVHDVEDAVASGRMLMTELAADEGRTKVIEAVEAWYGGIIPADELRAAIVRLSNEGLLLRGFDGSRAALAELKNVTSALIGRFVNAAEAATRREFGAGPLSRYGADLIVPRETQAEILVLKGTAVAYVMAPREHEPVYPAQRALLRQLVDVVLDRAPRVLEPAFAGDWAVAQSDAERLRVVIDQVASLTDVSAVAWHGRLWAGQ